VDETELVKIELGQEVEVVIDAYPDSTFAGVVSSIRGMPLSSLLSSSQEGVSYPVEVRLLRVHRQLYPGMSATCDIIVAYKVDVLSVPFTALGKREVDGKKRDVVFELEEGVARLTPLTLGVFSERKVEVKEGIEEEDTVLTGPFKVLRDLQDGDPIEPMENQRLGYRNEESD
jgi:HlyD family secretion protein